jgi:hypothetical protein
MRIHSLLKILLAISLASCPSLFGQDEDDFDYDERRRKTDLIEVVPESLYDNPKIRWRLPDVNPSILQPGVFYYGVLYPGADGYQYPFFSVVHESGEAKIGQRSGGHFAILRELIYQSARFVGKSEEDSSALALKAQRYQALSSNPFYHSGLGFGFKMVIDQFGRRVIKWHGFNSFKSTIHAHSNSEFDQIRFREIVISTISRKYKLPAMAVHPIDDIDLKLNPKYLDPKHRNFRGKKFLWAKADLLVDIISATNKEIGFPNFDIRPRTTVCERLSSILEWFHFH